MSEALSVFIVCDKWFLETNDSAFSRRNSSCIGRLILISSISNSSQVEMGAVAMEILMQGTLGKTHLFALECGLIRIYLKFLNYFD